MPRLFFKNEMRTVVIYPNWLFDFSRTLIMNPKNLPNNRMGSDPVSNNHHNTWGFFLNNIIDHKKF